MLVKIKDVCQVVSGATPSTSNLSFYDGNIYWITPKDLADNGNRKFIDNCGRKITTEGYNSCSTVMIPSNNILISTRAPIGYIAINKVDCCTNQGFKSLICDKQKVVVDYLFYLLKSRMNEIELLGSGTTFKEVSKTSIENFEIDLPTLETQEKIASILIKIDEQIERNSTMVKKLQVLSQAIFNKWFVQFDYPEFEGGMQYNPILKKDIPLGWTACKLTECIKWESSSQPPKSTFSDVPKIGYIRFIQNRDYDSQNHITYIPLKNTTKTCTKYDIMMDKYGDAGRIRCGLEGAYNVALAKITPTIQSSQEYIRQFLQRETNYEYLHNACMASTRASLNEQTLSGIIMPVPPQKVLSKFESIMKKMISYRFAITDSTNELIFIKEKLLPLLINGQLE